VKAHEIATCDEPFDPELTAEGLSRIDFKFGISDWKEFRN